MSFKSKTNIRAVILAAGKGTRMKSQKPKVLHEIFSKPLVGRVVEAIENISKEDEIKSVVVVGHGAGEVEKYLSKYKNVTCVLQKEQLGTGHAVSMALDELKNFKGTVIIACGDTPLLKSATLKKMCEYHEEHNADVTVMSAVFENPFGYGRIVRAQDGSVEAIVEQKDANDEQKAIKEVNTGVYCLKWESVKDSFKELKNNNSQGEYYLTDIISWARQKKKKALSFVIEDASETLGINSRYQLAQATEILKTQKLKELMDNGVTIVDPQSTSISPETTIGEDTIIYPNTYINGENKIGRNCKIGPFSHFRGNVEVGDCSKIGNFVELKNAVIGSHTNVSHLSYVGDASLGSNVNIGAGTIFANYNSITKEKKKSTLANGVSVGSNAVIVAPVELEENVFVGAGSVITKDARKDSLVLSRSAQKEYPQWVEKQKNLLNKKGEE